MNLSPPVSVSSANKISLEVVSSPTSPTQKSPPPPSSSAVLREDFDPPDVLALRKLLDGIGEHHLYLPTLPTEMSPTPSSSAVVLPVEDLDTPDELALRALLLGIHHRTLKAFDVARAFLVHAHEYQSELKVSTWIGGLAMFELAVLDLKEAEDRQRKRVTTTVIVVDGDAEKKRPLVNGDDNTKLIGDEDEEEEMKRVWSEVLEAACVKLDKALELATNSVDLSSRLDSRIAILKYEISTKRELLGIRS
jgi:hypothetical protein